MRRLEPKAKDRRKVAIPSDLRDSLREVFDLIRQAKRDPDIVLEYDAIQTERLSGGKFGKKARPFVLTYFPEGDHERGRWHLTLHRTDIEDIAEGRLTEITMYCCIGAECQYKFREPDEPCFYCDYVDDPNYGTFAFPAAESKLAERGITGINQQSSREDVVAALGTADESGGGIYNPPLGYMWPWVRFRRPDCQLRFEFDKAQKWIRNITILDKDWEPGK